MKKIILFFIVVLVTAISFSQGVVNRSTSAVTAQDSRFMAGLNMFVPRYADTSAALSGTNEGIDSAGALIYTYDYGLWYRNSNPKKWLAVSVGSASDNWRVTGNNNIIDGTNFIGTTNNVPFNIRVNNEKAGRVDNVSKNTSYGYQSANNNTSSNYNTAIGYRSLYTNTTGSANTILGAESLFFNTIGNLNVANGSQALYANTTGSYNLGIGEQSLSVNTTGNYNIGIGSNANVISNNLTNAVAIGANSSVGCSNCISLGDTTVPGMMIGAGTGYPTARLDVRGNVRIVDGTQGANKVFISDANGFGSWATNSSGQRFGVSGEDNSATQPRYVNFHGNQFLQLDSVDYFLVTRENSNRLGVNSTNSFLNSPNAVNSIINSNSSISLSKNGNLLTMIDDSSSLTKKISYLGDYHSTFKKHTLVDSDYVAQMISGNVANSWNILGNSGTVDGTNFIGTTDDVPFNIKVNNQKAGRIESIVTRNTFYGYQSGNVISSGVFNTGVGGSALLSNTTGQANTAVGALALVANVGGNYNSAFGIQSMATNVGGNGNTASGFQSLYGNLGGNYNTTNGYLSLSSNSSGSYNTANGYHALISNTTGSHNTAIGDSANVGNINLNNATAIGSHAYVTSSNSLVLGSINGINGATANTNVGIGVNAPDSTLHIVGGLKLVNGTQGLNRVLTSDANGGASWQSVSGLLNFSNGLTETGGTVKLGGSLTENTIINGHGSYSFTKDSLTYYRVSSDSAIFETGDFRMKNYSPYFHFYTGGGEAGFKWYDEYGVEHTRVDVEGNGDYLVVLSSKYPSTVAYWDMNTKQLVNTGSITSEGRNVVTKIENTATLDFPSTGAGAVSDLTITVTGAAVGDVVSLGVPNGSVTATATYTAWVSASNTVTIRFSPKATEDPASGTFKAMILK